LENWLRETLFPFFPFPRRIDKSCVRSAFLTFPSFLFFSFFYLLPFRFSLFSLPLSPLRVVVTCMHFFFFPPPPPAAAKSLLFFLSLLMSPDAKGMMPPCFLFFSPPSCGGQAFWFFLRFFFSSSGLRPSIADISAIGDTKLGRRASRGLLTCFFFFLGIKGRPRQS